MLKSDIEDQGWNVCLAPIEVGSIGIITKANKETIKKVAKDNNTRIEIKKFIQEISKLALISSFSIFHARNEPSWTDPPPLIP